jgi:tetratricopeptide (TPR) repeat protein
LQVMPPLLEDDVRGVRIEAASVLAPLHDHLPASYSDAFEAAAGEFRAAQRAVASRPLSHQVLAEFESRLGNEDLALAYSDQALRMAPDNALVHHSRGLLLVRLDRHDEALEELRLAAELVPQNSRFVYVYAVALNSLGQGEEAIRVLEKASRDHPDDADIAAFRDMLQQN